MEQLAWRADDTSVNSSVGSFYTEQEEEADRREEGGEDIRYHYILRLASGRCQEMGDRLRLTWKMRARDLNNILLYTVSVELGGNNKQEFQHHILQALI